MTKTNLPLLPFSAIVHYHSTNPDIEKGMIEFTDENGEPLLLKYNASSIEKAKVQMQLRIMTNMMMEARREMIAKIAHPCYMTNAICPAINMFIGKNETDENGFYLDLDWDIWSES